MSTNNILPTPNPIINSGNNITYYNNIPLSSATTFTYGTSTSWPVSPSFEEVVQKLLKIKLQRREEFFQELLDLGLKNPEMRLNELLAYIIPRIIEFSDELEKEFFNNYSVADRNLKNVIDQALTSDLPDFREYNDEKI